MDGLKRFAELIEGIEQRGAYRRLRPAQGADFSSNDYLALSNCPRIRRALVQALDRGVPGGAGGSRLLRGNHIEHERVEEHAASFFNAERALLFGSGYAANTALFATLPQRDDVVIYDQLVHASAHDGMKLGRAKTVAFAHNDADAAEDAIRTWRRSGGSGTPWIAVESLYSMEGTRAPLAELNLLAERHGAFLMIDEAHATGVFGVDGRGLAARFEGSRHILTLHTAGKALGASGALVTGPAILCDFLVNRARQFIFATAPTPLAAVALMESLAILKEEPERRVRLAALCDRARRGLQTQLAKPFPDSQILPVIIGANQPALRMAQALQAAGFDVRAIRPPTVPEGTARLRISITLHVDEPCIDALIHAVGAAHRECRPAAGLS